MAQDNISSRAEEGGHRVEPETAPESVPVSAPKIEPDMTVLDIIHHYRETEAVFKAYDAQAGVCICCSALFETLEDVSAAYGIDRDELLGALRQAACR